MISLLKKILKIKIKVKKPKQADVLVYDLNSFSLAKILFEGYKLSVICVRYEEVNLFIFFKSLLSNPFKIKENYIKNYVKYVSPKLIYSLTDNNPAFYKLKNFVNNIKLISDQKAIRDHVFLNSLKKDKNYLSCDISFVFTNYEKKELSEYIKSNFYLSGPNYNNTLPLLKKYDTNNVIFLSGMIPSPGIDNYEYEKKIFLNLVRYCEDNSLKLFFKEKCGFYDREFSINSLKNDLKTREFFFKNQFGNINKWVFVPHDIDKKSKLFKELYHESSLIIFSTSTLGYEFLSRGFKCVSFTNRFPVYGLEHLFEKKGLFWTDSSDFGEMKKLIDKIKNMESMEWEKIYKKYSKDILPYDENNKYKRSIIKKYLNL